MANQFLGQIEVFAFDFPPRGWAACAGQLLPIASNQALFALLGTTFGGDGRTTFALPDLRGRAAMGQGSTTQNVVVSIGAAGGEESHTLTVNETPLHPHRASVVSNADTKNNTFTPANNSVLATTTGLDSGGGALTFNIYAPDANPQQTMNNATIGPTGGQAHSNMMPYLGINFCIALTGIFPSRN